MSVSLQIIITETFRFFGKWTFLSLVTSECAGSLDAQLRGWPLLFKCSSVFNVLFSESKCLRGLRSSGKRVWGSSLGLQSRRPCVQTPLRYHPREKSQDLGYRELTWKVLKFQGNCQESTSNANWSQGHPKSWKIAPGILRKKTKFCENWFCNTYHAKCLVFQSQTSRFRPQNHHTKKPGKAS